MPETTLQELYTGYRHDFEELQQARKAYETTRKQMHGTVSDNKYYAALEEVTKRKIAVSYKELIDKCQNAINEAMDNLGPGSDAKIIQQMIDLENMILEVKNGGFTKPSPFTAVLDKLRAAKKLASSCSGKGVAGALAHATTKPASATEDNNPYGPKSLEADAKYRAAKMNNSKGTLLLLSGALTNMNRSFKTLGARAYFGLSEAKDSIYRAWKTKNLEAEIQYNRDLNDIARSINEEKVAELASKKQQEKGIFRNGAVHAANYLQSFTKTVTQELSVSNKRLTQMLMTEVQSMIKTIDRSEELLRENKTQGFDTQIIRMETEKVLSKAEKVIERIPNDTIFRTGVNHLSIVKQNGQIVYTKQSKEITREEFAASLFGNARTMSHNFRAFVEKEISNQAREEFQPRSYGEER